MDTLVYQAPKGSSIVECASRGDIDALVWLDSRCFDPPWPAEHYLRELEQPDAILQLVRDPESDRVVALLDARRVVDEVEVLRVAADPDHRRRGHSRALMTRLIADARRRSDRRILLDVAASNSAAVALYRSLGFVATGRRKQYYRGGDDALLLSLDIERTPAAAV